MTGPANGAAIVGLAEFPARRRADAPVMSDLEAISALAALALEDAQLPLSDLDGLLVTGIRESAQFAPATVAEYLGISLRFAETVDLGGAAAAGMIWRAAQAVSAGICRAALCVIPGTFPAPAPNQAGRFGASSYLPGSPQAEFDIPYGHVGQNALYAMFAQRYRHFHGYDPRAMARLVVHQRRNACANPDAIFFGKPIEEEDVLNSPMIARPLRLLEIVMPVWGGAAVIVASDEIAATSPHRPVRVAGFGERVSHKSPHQIADMLSPPIKVAAAEAFARAGIAPADVDCAQIYDCYTIAVLLVLEGAGFCRPGAGMAFLRERDFRFDGDFPLNTNGGQLGFGQARAAGGMTHVVEAVRQLAGRAQERQTPGCDFAFVTGNGGIMSEQVALVLAGA